MLQALNWFKLDWEADEFMQFVADVEATEDGSLQIMYGIDGRGAARIGNRKASGKLPASVLLCGHRRREDAP